MDETQKLEDVRTKLKKLIVDELGLEEVSASEIGDEDPLFGEGLGLDSLDAVEIVVILKRHFGVEMKNAENSREVFASVDSVARWVVSQQSANDDAAAR